MKRFYSTLGIDNAIKEQERDNIKANQKINNMSKTWQGDKIKHTAEHIGIISEGALKTLVSEIRQQDMEELIKMLEEFETYAYIPEFKKAIQDYYKN